MELEFHTVDQILVRTKFQISILKEKFNIPHENITVSIPLWFIENLGKSYNFEKNDHSAIHKLISANVIYGSNNQIVVFDIFAVPMNNFLEPIKICETKLVNMYDYVSPK